MKIIRARHSGMCFGVRDALRRASAEVVRGPLAILGQLVHNPVIQQRLAQAGARVGSLEDLNSGGDSERVLITAHGAADAQRSAWQTTGREVIDTTCPLVRRAHEQLRALVESGHRPVVIGQAAHVEVRGLCGDFEGVTVIESEADLSKLPERGPFGVVSQTTQPAARVARLVESIRRMRPGEIVRFCDTICQPTKDRQAAMEELCREADTIVVVGGRASNNTRQLAEAAQRMGRVTYHIERAEELQPRWFVQSEAVGVTAGTSTLDETLAAVCSRLEEFAKSRRLGMLEGCAR